ncbi:hypothetical protein YC2023_089056 [Brassica napus]
MGIRSGKREHTQEFLSFLSILLILMSYVRICAKRSKRKGSTQPPTRYCCRKSVRKENKQIKGITAP